jgi:hypothetical protein
MNGVAFAVHQSSRRSEVRKFASITRSPSVAVVSEIAPRWTIALDLAAVEPAHQFRRRNEIGELAPGEVAPFLSVAEHVADRDIAPPGLVERRHYIRADKTGAAGDQEHSRRLFDSR